MIAKRVSGFRGADLARTILLSPRLHCLSGATNSTPATTVADWPPWLQPWLSHDDASRGSYGVVWCARVCVSVSLSVCVLGLHPFFCVSFASDFGLGVAGSNMAAIPTVTAALSVRPEPRCVPRHDKLYLPVTVALYRLN